MVAIYPMHRLKQRTNMKRIEWIQAALLAVGIMVWSATANAQSGRIETGEMTSGAVATNLFGDPGKRSYQVYLPPSYGRGTNRYPVIYVLHGYYGDEAELLDLVRASLDALIAQRQIGELIAVFPNAANRLNGSFYLGSSAIGDYETYLTQDLVRTIDERYRTLSARESRGVTGYSMGGWGAMHLALKFPEVFSVVVAEGGFYDAIGPFVDGISRQLASQAPTTLAQFDALDFPLNACVALFAGLAPNPTRAGLFTDFPYELVNGQVVAMEAVRQRAVEGDIQHGDLGRYLQGTARMRGIKVVHGTADAVIPVGEARRFTNALATAGVDFEYQQHSGGHVYRPELALPFLSARLQGAERFISPPRLTLTLGAGSVRVAFATQTNVQYIVESTEALGDPVVSWTEQRRLDGDGRTATVNLPPPSAPQFFRVRAANAP